MTTVFCMLLSVLILLTAGSACAQNDDELYRYLDIPFEEATPELVAQTLLEQRGVSFEKADNVLSGDAADVQEFGYRFRLQYDFRGNYTDTHRILLSSAQPVRVPQAEYAARIRSDLEQFLDMEGQLSALYGEPDCRWFCLERASTVHKGGRYMFANGLWELEALLDACGTDSYFKAYSVWHNVVLLLWADGQTDRGDGKWTSRVMLYYYPKLKDTDGLRNAKVSVWP